MKIGFSLIREDQGIPHARFFKTYEGALKAFLEEMEDYLDWPSNDGDTDPKLERLRALVEDKKAEEALTLWLDHFEDKHNRDIIYSIEPASLGE